MLKVCWKCVESKLNWFKLLFNIDSTFSLFLTMLNGVETVWTLRSSNIRTTFVERMLGKCWNRLNGHLDAFPAISEDLGMALNPSPASLVKLCEGCFDWSTILMELEKICSGLQVCTTWCILPNNSMKMGYTMQSNRQDFFYVSFRSICAFLNSGKCGTVYLGIRHDGVVAGLRIDRKQVNDQ